MSWLEQLAIIIVMLAILIGWGLAVYYKKRMSRAEEQKSQLEFGERVKAQHEEIVHRDVQSNIDLVNERYRKRE